MKTPDRLRFATGGIPLSTEPRNTINGIKQIKALGLSGMELEFVRSVNISEKLAPEVKKTAEEENVLLTIHGQYFFNLNAQDKRVLTSSIKRAVDAGIIGQQCGAWSICYHSAYLMGMTTEQVYKNVKKGVREILAEYKRRGIALWFRPEIGGKLSQFGGIKDLCELSAEFDQVLPCIDWSHLQARANGNCNTEDKFREVLATMEKINGKESLRNVHFHAQGVKYGAKGEIAHLEFKDSEANYPGWAKVWKEFKLKGQVVCESPNLETDALSIKKAYEKA